ncbi:MAG: DUF4238 domain-containing protein [Alphaproteobacteria bacterium]|nr:MAG: DUF4238 domain-containing protein [Alphaproteobacteria bacterium]
MRPIQHHYIPVFYLKRWAGPDGKLCEFSRPFKSVVPLRRAPSGTGFSDRLYELRDFPSELAQQVEEGFFRTVDTRAADALALMERHGNSAAWTLELRSAWSRFIISLLTRCPEDLAIFRERWSATADRVDARMEQEYAALRGADDPKTMAEYIAAEPAGVKEKSLFEAFMRLMDNPKISQRLNPLHWYILDLPDGEHELLTSDRPIVHTNGVGRRGGFMAMPLGPRRLFLAAPEGGTIEAVAKSDPRALARRMNVYVTEGAVKCVYGTNDAQLQFVSNRMSRNPQRRLMTGMIDHEPPSPSALIGLDQHD